MFYNFVMLFYIIHQLFILIALEKESLAVITTIVTVNTAATILGYFGALETSAYVGIRIPPLFGIIFFALFYTGMWFTLLQKKGSKFTKRVLIPSLGGLLTAIVFYKLLKWYVDVV